VAPVILPDLTRELTLRASGHRWVAGMDEVGRGAWAGPVSVGVALMKRNAKADRMPPWLRDSKLLTEVRRESIFSSVRTWCSDWAVGHASPEECDHFGMTIALRLAAERALGGLRRIPDALIVDGPRDLLRRADGEGSAFGGTVHPVVDADALCGSVAAASVLAKVVRDRMMRRDADSFPAYEFEHNKGYPSPVHQLALRGYGLTSIHRRSWVFAENLPWSCVPRPAPA